MLKYILFNNWIKIDLLFFLLSINNKLLDQGIISSDDIFAKADTLKIHFTGHQQKALI